MTRLMCCALPLFLLFLLLPERALAEGPGMLFYGSSKQGVEFRIEADETGDGLFLRLFRRDGHGRFEPVVPSTRFLPNKHTPLGFEGVAFVRGRPVRVRISLSQDNETLRWLEPATLSLIDGPDIRMAGDYARNPDEQLLSDARISLSRADALLNDEYNRLRNSLPKQAFELL